MKPYYLDEQSGIAIIHADCRDVLPMLEPVDLVLTDPPYSATTHEGARTTVYGAARGGGVTAIDFASTDADFIREVLSQCCPRRWCISFIDWKHALPLAEIPPEGLRFVRLGAWVKLNPMPQLTGDRPSTGWESVVIFHPPGRMRWNGGSGPAVWMHGTTRYGYFGPSNHPTEKPIGLVRKILEQFSDPGETILDPFMGSGTTLRAAKDLGRKAIGIEISEEYCQIAVQRLQQQTLPLSTQEVEQRQVLTQPTMFSGMARDTDSDEVAVEVGLVDAGKVADR